MYGLTHRKKPARESSELASISAAVAALEVAVVAIAKTTAGVESRPLGGVRPLSNGRAVTRLSSAGNGFPYQQTLRRRRSPVPAPFFKDDAL